MQRSQGLSISVLEEIAFNNGWISHKMLAEAAARYGKSGYGKHLKKVADGQIVPLR